MFGPFFYTPPPSTPEDRRMVFSLVAVMLAVLTGTGYLLRWAGMI
jgi:hypothetical protein